MSCAPDRRPIAGPLFRRKAVSQRQPVEALAKPAREIVVPARALQAAALPDLRHGHALDQHIVDQRGAIGAELAFDAIEPQHGPALSLGERLARLRAVDIFAGGVDSLRPALSAFPIALEGAPGPILRVVDLLV
jgi:hypothetical protein